MGSSGAVEIDQFVGKLEELKVFNLSREELELLSTDASISRFGRRETILKSGEESGGLFGVVSAIRDSGNCLC